MPTSSSACAASIARKCLPAQEIFIACDSTIPTRGNNSLRRKLLGRPLPISNKIVWLTVAYKPYHERQPEFGIPVAIGFSNYKFSTAECSPPLLSTILGSKCGQR